MAGGLQSVGWGNDPLGGFKELNKQLRLNRGRVISAGLAVLEAQLVEELSTPGRGKIRWHRVKRKGRVTAKAFFSKSKAAITKAGRASAPGDPPAPDYGTLRQSIHSEYDSTLQKGRVGTNDKRAPALNYGTTRAGKSRKVVILPRPFMEPALKKALVAMALAGVTALQLHPVVRARQ